MGHPQSSIPDNFTAIRRAHKAKAIEVAQTLGVHNGELTACLDAEDAYRAGSSSRADFVLVLEQVINDRPDLEDAVRNIWATAWHSDEVAFLERGI